MVEFACGSCDSLVSETGRFCPYCGVEFQQTRCPACGATDCPLIGSVVHNKPTRQWNDSVIMDRGSSVSTGARRYGSEAR